MRDVSSKTNTLRTATAVASLRCLPETIIAIRQGNVPKADPLGVAKIAGIQGAKNTSGIIPYCHQVPLDFVAVNLELKDSSIDIHTEVKAVWKTGVEMEALVAASVAALTLYDMLKMIDDTMEIGTARITSKVGGKSDLNKDELKNLRAAVLVMSDQAARGKREDMSGKAIAQRLQTLGIAVTEYKVLPDDAAQIEREICRLCDNAKLDIILTTGGTGLGPRDVTPQVTKSIIERELPGIAEFLRSHGQERSRYSMLSRGLAGVRGKTVVVNLPGSPGAVDESMNVLFPWLVHAFSMMRGEGH